MPAVAGGARPDSAEAELCLAFCETARVEFKASEIAVGRWVPATLRMQEVTITKRGVDLAGMLGVRPAPLGSQQHQARAF